METTSPLFIKANEDSSLDPTSADNTYLAFYKDGKQVPVIPGTSIKGVFRSNAEAYIRALGLGVCDVLNNPCGNIINKEQRQQRKKYDVVEKYARSCPICKVFGTTTMKSRANFYDAFPDGEFKIGKRTSVGIDRITGASRRGALFDFEYVEYCDFKSQIKLKNFFPWQLKLIFDLFDRVNDGLIAFGGLTSKGFGRIEVNKINLELRYYNSSKLPEGYTQKDYFICKKVEGEEVYKIFKDIRIDNNSVKRCDLENEQIL